MIADKFVVLTYALRALEDAGVTKHLAFKGGTCLRKTVFGSAVKWLSRSPVEEVSGGRAPRYAKPEAIAGARIGAC